MARMNAISQMHNAQWAMMQNNMAMMSMCRNMPAFGGNMAMLNEMDKQIEMSNAQNQLLYQIASAQEKAAAARIAQELKDNKVSYVATA